MSQHDKSPHFIVHQAEPFNGGVSAADLRAAYLTPYPMFYVRSHAKETPQLDAESYRLSVGGRLTAPLSLSLAQLHRDFEQRTVTATLQCAGNRRRELNAVAAMPGESVMWGDEAISTAVWQGVSLADVLARAGVTDGTGHVAFESYDACEKDGQTFGYGGSIPLEKALRPEVLLAYGMNGEPLPALHGYPLRVIVPGYIAARSVKWLKSITVQDTPSDNHYQAYDYKLFPPHITADTIDWDKGEMLGAMRTDAVLCHPRDGQTLPAGVTTLKGYAIAGEGARITGVEVSTDGGVTWRGAQITTENTPYAWCFWEVSLNLTRGPHTLLARAHDSLGAIQPTHPREVWNVKGYMNNAQHRVSVTVM